jgi:hypothetical protein
VPNAGDFRVDVGNEAQAELQKKLSALADERIAVAMEDAKNRLKEHLDRMMRQLRVEEVNGKQKKGRIHTSLIEGGLELCDALKSLNITNDITIEAARVELEKLLRSVDADDLRKQVDARTEIRSQVADIVDRFNF